MKYNKAKLLFAIPAWLLGVALCLAPPLPSRAAEEGSPCSPEPTDMYISYGDLVICSIEPSGDSDLYRFDGSLGEVIVVQASRQDGSGTPCIELLDPDGLLVGSKVCSVFGARIDTQLGKTGTHTVRVSENLNDDTVDYALALERIAPPSPPARTIQYDDLVSDEINPVGDIDLFFFEGGAGDTISVLASRQGGGTPCIELFGPYGEPIDSKVCSVFGAEIQATLDETGTHTVLVSEDLNDGTVQYALGLQCFSGDCIIVPIPDVCGWAKHEGIPLSDRRVILKQRGEDRQRTKTDANGYYEFESIAPGKKYKVIIKGPRHE